MLGGAFGLLVGSLIAFQIGGNRLASLRHAIDRLLGHGGPGPQVHTAISALDVYNSRLSRLIAGERPGFLYSLPHATPFSAQSAGRSGVAGFSSGGWRSAASARSGEPSE